MEEINYAIGFLIFVLMILSILFLLVTLFEESKKRGLFCGIIGSAFALLGLMLIKGKDVDFMMNAIFWFLAIAGIVIVIWTAMKSKKALPE